MNAEKTELIQEGTKDSSLTAHPVRAGLPNSRNLYPSLDGFW